MNCKLEDSVFEPFGSAILVQSETLKEISLLKVESSANSRVSIAFKNSGYSRCSYVFGSAFNSFST